MNKMIMSLLVATLAAATASAASAHRPTSPPQEKPDFVKTFFDQQQRDGR